MEFFKLSRVKFILFLLSAFITSSCTWTDPYVDRRRDAGKIGTALYVGMSSPQKPVICYNPFVTKEAELQKMADEQCTKHNTGKRAILIEDEFFACSMTTPKYATFECVNEE